MIFTALFLFCLWSSVFWGLKWINTDAPLSKESKALIANVKKYDPHLKEHPYFLVLGFDAKADVNPYELGSKRYHTDWKWFYENDLSADQPTHLKSSIRQDVGLFFLEKDEKIFDLIREKSAQGFSYQILLEHQHDLQRMNQDQSLLNSRFQQFLNLPVNERVLLTNYLGETANFSLMVKIHQLHLSNLAFHKNIADIEAYLKLLIQKDRDALPLIDKFVYQTMISQTIDVINDLNRLFGINFSEIQQFSHQQLSLENALSYEFASGFELNVKMNEEVNLFKSGNLDSDHNEHSVFKGWAFKHLSKLLFHTNMTANQSAQVVWPYIQDSKLDFKEFKSAPKHNPVGMPIAYKVKNYLGNIFSSIGNPDWGRYAIRLRLLDQKIRVLNVLNKQRSHFDLKQLNQNSDGFEYYKAEGQLCIRSPKPLSPEDEKKYKSCLSI